MAGAGLPMGGNVDVGDTANHYLTLIIASNSAEDQPYIFPFSHLIAPPLRIPLSVERSLVQLQWRSVPYAAQGTGDLASVGKFLWQRTGG